MIQGLSAIQRVSRTSLQWERSLGISQRASRVDFGWHGEIRLRFTDFQVYEIGPDGKVVHLQDTSLPGSRSKNKEDHARDDRTARDSKQLHDGSLESVQSGEAGLSAAAQEEGAALTHQSQTASTSGPTVPSAEDTAPLAALTNDEFVQALVVLYRFGVDSQSSSTSGIPKPPAPTTAIITDKPARSQIHNLVRTIFNSRIDTATQPNGSIATSLRLSSRAAHSQSQSQSQSRRQRRDRGDPSRQREQPSGEYLHFTLFKENRDTLDAISHLARILRTKPALIGTAGTKDRRAATAQRCSLRHGRAESLARTNGRVYGVVVGDFAYAAIPIHLGWHVGNEFVITVKHCQLLGGGDGTSESGNDDVLQIKLATLRDRVGAAVASAASNGWINYFGHQRFGTHTTGTHEIGMLILRGEFSAAVDAILHHDPTAVLSDEDDEKTTTTTTTTTVLTGGAAARDAYSRNKACALFAQGQRIEAVALMPPRFTAETSVMKHLVRPGCDRDFTGAITSITRGLKTMYLHAYQSLVWNHAASKRWETWGRTVVTGDLVLEGANAGGELQHHHKTSEDDEDQAPTYGDDVQEDGDVAAAQARPLTAEEAASGKWTIFDVVLPTPGTNVVYPSNEIGQFYTDFMAAANGDGGGGLDPTNMHRAQRDFSLTGRYRKLVGRFLAEPRWEVRAYARDEEQMHPTDADIMRKAREQGRRERRDGRLEERAAKREREREEDDPEDVVKRQRLDEETVVAERPTKAPTDDVPADDVPADDVPVEDSNEVPDKMAVVLRFQLPKSAYATVVLRELMGQLPDETTGVTL